MLTRRLRPARLPACMALPPTRDVYGTSCTLEQTGATVKPPPSSALCPGHGDSSPWLFPMLPSGCRGDLGNPWAAKTSA
jgi:hypothetical protein